MYTVRGAGPIAFVMDDFGNLVAMTDDSFDQAVRFTKELH